MRYVPEVVRTPMIRRFTDWFDVPDLFGDLDRFFAWPDRPVPGTARIKVEEEVVGDELVIRAELPGIDPDTDAEITVEDGVLVIRAERTKELEDQHEGTFRSEFHYGSFVRRLLLPAGVSADDVKASYADGILEVRVPMPEPVEVTGRKVEITKP